MLNKGDQDKYTHCTDGDIEALKSEVICAWSLGRLVAEIGINPRSSESIPSFLP